MNTRRLKFHQLKPGMKILFNKPDRRGDASYTRSPLKVTEIFDNYITYDTVIGIQWAPSHRLYLRQDMDGRMVLANYKMLKALGITGGTIEA